MPNQSDNVCCRISGIRVQIVNDGSNTRFCFIFANLYQSFVNFYLTFKGGLIF